MDPDKWEFANEGFLRGQRHLLKNIKRRKTTASNLVVQAGSNQGLESCVEVGTFGLDGEIERLKRDKQVLMMELVKLRQQQQQTNSNLKQMEQRLKGTEVKQQQTMSFLARAIKNPSFLQQMAQQKGKMKEIEEAICKKRMKRIDAYGLGLEGSDHNAAAGFGDFVGDENDDIYVKLEPQEFGDNNIGSGVDVELEFERLAKSSMNMGEQILLHDQDSVDDIQDHNLGVDKSFDDGFWGDLIEGALEDEIDTILLQDPN